MAWVRIANVNEVPEGTGKTFTINNHQIAVFQVEGQFYALDDTCSHAEASLGEGEVDVEERCVECRCTGRCSTSQPGSRAPCPPTSQYLPTRYVSKRA